MALNAQTQTILYHNWSHYWPEYVHLHTNLSLSFLKPVESIYQPLGLDNTRLWGKPRFTYLPSPPPHILVTYKHCFMDHNYHTLHIMISPFTHDSLSLAIYWCSLMRRTIYEGCKKGVDYTQAICQAVYNALTLSLLLHDGPVLLGLRPKTIPDKILMFNPHRDSHVTYDI